MRFQLSVSKLGSTMKIFVISICLLIFFSDFASASCPGGRYAVTCTAVNPSTTALTVEIRGPNQKFLHDQILLLASGSVVNQSACLFDELKLRNDNPVQCGSGDYSYTLLNTITPPPPSANLFIQGAFSILQNFHFGFIATNNVLGERVAFGCQRIIECPVH